MNQNTKENPLEIRIHAFVMKLIKTIKEIHQTLLNRNILSQVLRSGTSIGANFREAQECESRNDFIHKISICKKESRESVYWLEILKELSPDKDTIIRDLIRETNEFVKIFAASVSTAKKNSRL